MRLLPRMVADMSDEQEAAAEPSAPGDEAGEVLEEDLPTSTAPAYKTSPVPPTHEDKTRRAIAIGLVILLSLLAGVGCYGWIAHPANSDHLQAFGILFSPVVTLVGTVLGFYFGRPPKG